MKKNWVKIIRFLPAIIWMGFIFFLSSRQTTGIGDTELNRFLILKSFHVIEYTVLIVFIFFAINKFKTSIVLTYIYALSDEFHQLFVPGRTGKFQDTLIDLIGITIGIIVIKYFPKIKRKLSD